MDQLKVWLDDWRPAPDGWVWKKSVEEVKSLLHSGSVSALHLDHDLGGGRAVYDYTVESGSDLVKWMVDNRSFPGRGIIIHSINPVGREFMYRTLLDAVKRLNIPIGIGVWPLPDTRTWQKEVEESTWNHY